MLTETIFFKLRTVLGPAITSPEMVAKFTKLADRLSDEEALRIYAYVRANPTELDTLFRGQGFKE